MDKYLITDEWYEGYGYTISTAYGKRAKEEIDNLCDYMEKYSPYDYAVPTIYETKQEYLKALRLRMDNGCKITDQENEL